MYHAGKRMGFKQLRHVACTLYNHMSSIAAILTMTGLLLAVCAHPDHNAQTTISIPALRAQMHTRHVRQSNEHFIHC